MKDNEKTVLLGGVTYDETNLPYQLAADYDEDNEEEKYLQRANVLFQYPYEEINPFMGLGVSDNNVTVNYYNPRPIESNVRDLRKEQDIIASQAKANRVYVPEKQNNQRIDYINKPLMNNGLTYIPEKNEIEMKPKKPIKQEKNYEEIANGFYPNMPEKSQIQETKRIPLLGENNQEPIKYYDDYPTLANRNYVVEPIDNHISGEKVMEKNISWIMPCSGKISSYYGNRTAPKVGASTFHSGIDIAVPIGTPVKAIADGFVFAVNTKSKGYGKVVFINHGTVNGTIVTSEYGHLSSILVNEGIYVKQGQIIAYSGNTGVSSGAHLHLTIREGAYKGKPVNPYKYIKN